MKSFSTWKFSEYKTKTINIFFLTDSSPLKNSHQSESTRKESFRDIFLEIDCSYSMEYPVDEISLFNRFSTNVPLTDKPGSCLLLAKYLKNTCETLTSENVTLAQLFFKHFAGKKQLPGFYIYGTLVKSELMGFRLTTHPLNQFNKHKSIWLNVWVFVVGSSSIRVTSTFIKFCLFLATSLFKFRKLQTEYSL